MSRPRRTRRTPRPKDLTLKELQAMLAANGFSLRFQMWPEEMTPVQTWAAAPDVAKAKKKATRTARSHRSKTRG